LLLFMSESFLSISPSLFRWGYFGGAAVHEQTAFLKLA
jgi:hypothetical protein